MRKSAYIAALLLAISCNEVLMEPQKTGSISLLLASDVEVVADTKNGADNVDCSDFLVDIYGTTFLGQEYASEQYVYKSMPDVVTIPYGYYHVSAQSCLEAKAAEGFGCVRYYGVSEQTDVLSPTPASVTVNCKMVNAKVTINFDDSFLEDFSDISVALSCTRDVTLTSEQANAPTDVYFNLSDEGAPFAYTIYGTVAKGTVNEKKLTYRIPSTMLYPAKWAKITLKSNHNGYIGPDVSVDSGMGDDSIVEVINPEESDSVTNGDLNLPSILIDTQVDDAVVVDCIIDIY